MVRTSAPRWLFDLTLTAPVDWQPLECDTGIVQIDSLRLDATRRRRTGGRVPRDTRRRARDEARLLRELERTAGRRRHPAARVRGGGRARASRRSALGNFTWDWIYAGYRRRLTARPTPDRDDSVPHTGRPTAALRLPMHGGFETCRHVTDVPFIARRARRDPDESGARFGLPASRAARARVVRRATASRRSTSDALASL